MLVARARRSTTVVVTEVLMVWVRGFSVFRRGYVKVDKRSSTV